MHQVDALHVVDEEILVIAEADVADGIHRRSLGVRLGHLAAGGAVAEAVDHRHRDLHVVLELDLLLLQELPVEVEKRQDADGQDADHGRDDEDSNTAGYADVPDGINVHADMLR